MPHADVLEPQFWLLIGTVPSGPFTASQIHQKIAAGDIASETPACLVGGNQWLPIVATPGLGSTATTLPTAALLDDQPMTASPVQPAPQSAIPVPPNSTPTATPTPTPPAPKQDWLGLGFRSVVVGVVIVVVLGGLGGAIYGLYEWLRPDSAREVCEKFEKATTAVEAKRYATVRMHRLTEETFRNTPDNPNDHFEFTHEMAGPANSKLIGICGSIFLQEEGQRVRIEGHLKVIKMDGWKVDDTVISGVEGLALPGPISLVDDYQRQQQMQQPKAGPLLPPSQPKPRPFPPLPPTTRTQTPLEKKFWALQETLGWGELVALGIGIVVVMGVYGHLTDKKKK